MVIHPANATIFITTKHATGSDSQPKNPASRTKQQNQISPPFGSGGGPRAFTPTLLLIAGDAPPAGYGGAMPGLPLMLD